MSYQGWANNATYVVHLHLTNDEGLFRGAREALEDAKPMCGVNFSALDIADLQANALHYFVNDLFENIDLNVIDPATMMRSELLQSALKEIDWDAIIEDLMEE